MAKDPGKGKVPLGGAASTSAPPSSPFAALAGLRGALRDVPVAAPAPATMAPPSPFADKVVVRLERKGHGGKTVTLVSGVKADHREAFAQTLKKKLGTGARIEGDDIVIQGDVVDRTIAFVTAAGARRVVKGSG